MKTSKWREQEFLERQKRRHEEKRQKEKETKRESAKESVTQKNKRLERDDQRKRVGERE